MSEKKLSSDQLQRIEMMKGEWLEEIGKVSKPAKYTWPDCSMGKEYRLSLIHISGNKQNKSCNSGYDRYRIDGGASIDFLSTKAIES